MEVKEKVSELKEKAIEVVEEWYKNNESAITKCVGDILELNKIDRGDTEEEKGVDLKLAVNVLKELILEKENMEYILEALRDEVEIYDYDEENNPYDEIDKTSALIVEYKNRFGDKANTYYDFIHYYCIARPKFFDAQVGCETYVDKLHQ